MLFIDWLLNEHPQTKIYTMKDTRVDKKRAAQERRIMNATNRRIKKEFRERRLLYARLRRRLAKHMSQGT